MTGGGGGVNNGHFWMTSFVNDFLFIFIRGVERQFFLLISKNSQLICFEF